MTAEPTETDIVPTNTQTPVDTARAAAEIDFDDPMLTVNYGATTMTEIAKFSDSILSKVRVKDSGDLGKDLTDIMTKVKGFDVEGVAQKGFLESIPVIGRLFDGASRGLAQYDTISKGLSLVTERLSDAQFGLIKDINLLEEFFKLNQNYYGELTAYIDAGKAKLAEARAVEIPRLEERAKVSGEVYDAQVLRDFADKLDRFEKRLHDLSLSREITVQTAPQIRMIQNNDRMLAEKIQTSILATIPIWKNQLILALSLRSQKAAAALQADVTNTTNAMLRKNADMLHQATVETVREANRSVVDIETLKETQAKLVSTFEESLAICTEAREKRREADSALSDMREELRTKLLTVVEKTAAATIEAAKAKNV